MLELLLNKQEIFNDKTQTFSVTGTKVQFEHSLYTVSKWEEKWEIPFLNPGKDEKTPEQVLDYIRIMCLTPDIPEDFYTQFSKDDLEKINKYISAKGTATWIRDNAPKRRGPIITSEVIYGWMISLAIPFEPSQHWHLNKLITQIRVVNENNKPKKKVNPRDAASRMSAINAARRAKTGTNG